MSSGFVLTRLVGARGGWGRRLTHCRRSPSHPPHAPTTGPDHASSYGHEGDGGDVSPIVADLRPIPLMPRQPAQITHHRTGTRGMGATSRPSSQISVPSPSCPDNQPISRIIVRARGGWGRRLAHCRRSPSHPPHAPTTGPDHASSYGHEGDGGDVSPIVADLRPIPLMPRQPAQYHASSYGHEGDGGDVSPIVADLRPIPLMPRQPAQYHDEATTMMFPIICPYSDRVEK